MKTRDEALSCTVISLIPWVLKESKPGLYPGHFIIQASDTKTPSVIHITNKTIHFVYLDDTRGSMIARDPSDEVAASIVRDYISSQLGTDENARPALFWVPGKYEVDEIMQDFDAEIKAAQVAQNQWFLNLVRMADDDWTRYHKHNVVSDFQRKAAELIGWTHEDHEWMKKMVAPAPKDNTPMKNCIACFSVIDERALVCPVCRCKFPAAKDAGLVFSN